MVGSLSSVQSKAGNNKLHAPVSLVQRSPKFRMHSHTAKFWLQVKLQHGATWMNWSKPHHHVVKMVTA